MTDDNPVEDAYYHAEVIFWFPTVIGRLNGKDIILDLGEDYVRFRTDEDREI